MLHFLAQIFAKIGSAGIIILSTLGLVHAPVVPTPHPEASAPIFRVVSDLDVAVTLEAEKPKPIASSKQEKVIVPVVPVVATPVTQPKTFITPSGAVVDERGNLIKAPDSVPMIVAYNSPVPQSLSSGNNSGAVVNNSPSFKFDSIVATPGPSGVSISWKANMPTWQEIYIDFYLNGKFINFYSGKAVYPYSTEGRAEIGTFTSSILPGTHYDVELIAREKNVVLDRISTSFDAPKAEFGIGQYTIPEEPTHVFFKINKNYNQIHLEEIVVQIITDSPYLSTPLPLCTRWDTPDSAAKHSFCPQISGKIMVGGRRDQGDLGKFESDPFSKDAYIVSYKAIDELTGQVFIGP